MLLFTLLLQYSAFFLLCCHGTASLLLFSCHVSTILLITLLLFLPFCDTAILLLHSNLDSVFYLGPTHYLRNSQNSNISEVNNYADTMSE